MHNGPPRGQTHLPVDGPLRALMGAATKPHLVAAPIKARSDFTPAIENPNATINPQMRAQRSRPPVDAVMPNDPKLRGVKLLRFHEQR